MIKLKDVAEKAGVSKGAVSAVLGKSKLNIRVSPETAERIRAIAQEMSYVPNFSAKVLNGKASKTFGVLIDSIEPAVHFQQLAAIERAADRVGCRILVAEAHDSVEKQAANYRILRQYGVDGIICHAYGVHKYIDPSDKVVIWGASPREGFMSVYYDIATGYAEAAEHLRNRKRNRIGLALSDIFSYDSLTARYRAFQYLYPGAENMVFKLNAPVLDSECIRQEMHRLVREFVVPRKIDALIMQNDVFAVALLSILPGYGIRVPEDLAIIGQDNDFFGRCVTPALTTIDTNIEQLARTMVDMLRELIENPEKERFSIAIPTKLITRETC